MTTLVSLARPRLARRVVAALREEHVVVLAPAGYGKSTLLRALALQHAGAQVVSLSLEDADIVHLQARLRPLLVQGATLLLDDVHHLQGAGESLAWLNDQLASSTSASTRFVLSGRLLPDATWRKRFVVFDADRLGFSPTEATALLSGLPGLTPQAIEQWRVRTRGWPLLLSVLVRQMDGLDDATQSRLLRSAGQVSDDDLLSYLAERMIRLLPRELFQFMQTMALPTQFSDALAADVLGASVSQAIALRDEVERRNLFIEPIAPDGWFKFHDFVREYLLNRAKRLSLAAFENNFARIVDWFEAHTDVPMAIEQALAGAVFERAARLMGTIAPTFVTQTGRYRTLQRWVMALPDSVLAAHPLLSMQLGLNLREMGMGWRETAWQHLNKALRDAAQHPDLEIQARVRLGVASGHIHEGEAAQALAIAHPMLDDTKLSASLRRRALKAAANAHYYQSQFSSARGLLQAALALPADASSVSNIALRQNLIMTSLLPLGDFEQSAAQLALIDAESAGQAGLQIWQQLCWAWLHEAMGDWDALRADLREMRRIQAQTEVADDEDVVEVFMRANACVGQGQFNEAERLLQTCDKNMSDNPEERLTLAQCKAWLARRQKNFDEAIRICDAALAEDWDVPMAQSVVALEREIARFADGLAPELLPLLQRLLTLRARPCLVRWRALLALQCHALGDARWRRHAASVLRQTRRAGYDKLLISREPELGAQFWAMCLVEDIDSERASAALTEIGQIEPVLALLRSAKSSQTSRAARVLAAIGHEAAIPALAEALNTAKDAATKRDIESALTTLELAPPPTLHIKLMGDFAVTRGTNSIKPEDWERPSARMLFQYLALNAGKKLTRDQIIEDLWPEADPDAARGTLKTTLSRMRKAIEPYLRPKSPARYFSVEGEVYRFGLEFVRTDVAEFERIVRATLHEAEQHDVLPVSDDLITQLLDYQPILPDLQYQAWTIALRERLLDLYVKGCGYVARARLDVNESADAARWAERAIAAAPWSEESYQSLMRAQSRQGDRALALRTYSVCAAALHHELGVPPSPLTEWLAKRLKAGEAI